MKIAYLHGLESSIDKKDPKIIFMNETFDEVYAPQINYKDPSTFNKLLNDIKKFQPDLIVGSSMGGYVSYLIGSKLSIRTILFNPAVVGKSFDPVVDDLSLKDSTHHVYFGKNDKVIDGKAVRTYFNEEGVGNFKYNSYNGGHRVPATVFIYAIKNVLKINEINNNIKTTIMKHIKLFEEFMLEKEGDSYSAGCVMLYFDFPEIERIHAKIDQEDLYEEEGDRTFGLEDEPHCTLLYGLKESVTVSQVEEIIDRHTFGTCTLYKASLFENEYDVLKFDVKGDSLHECNAALCELPYSSDYPDYHPHSTIAYLKKGTGKKYCEVMKGDEYRLVPSYAVYSQPDGTKTKIKIKID